jgi:hypothetical protein
MGSRRTGTVPLCSSSISIERHSAVEGKEQVTSRLIDERGSVHGRNGRNGRNAAARRWDAYGTAAGMVHCRTA